MKKIALLLLLTICGFLLQAQTLKFCKSVDDNGKPVGEDTEFTISKGDQVIFYLIATDVLNTTKIRYKIYKVNYAGDLKYDNTIQQEIHEDWQYAWKGIKINKAGTYKVNAYNSNNTLLSSATISIILKTD